MAAEAAVAFLLEKVTGVTTGYADLISGAAKEFKELQDDVKLLKENLRNLSSTSSNDHGVKQVLDQVRDAVYEVEDSIDSCLTQAVASRRRSKLKQGMSVLSPNHVSLAKQVKSLRKEKVKGILETAKEIASSSQGSATTSKEEEEDKGIRRTDHVVREHKLVNRDEKMKIIGSLLKAQPALDIIAVVGIPGMGKTTLAWQIFNDGGIRYAFPIRIWVHISQRFDLREVLVKIMEHFTDDINDLYSMSNQELQHAVFTCLSQAKFLLVMDDVWKTEHWDDIRSVLPESNGDGKVLITSRDVGVGRHATESHQLKYLDTEESWELLQLEVFGENGKCPPELQKIGKDISKKCKGVPLTIVMIGGVLKDHYLSSESNGVVEKKWAEMEKNENFGADDIRKIISDVVQLSYDRLPHHLRDCFIYLGVFPAGYEIPTWTLTRLWIAEGFIQPDDENRSLEKIAEDNLDDLISRNLLMVHKRNPMGEVKVCLVPDIIRDFCVHKAAEQDMFQEIKMEEEHSGALMAKMEQIRRICLHSDLDKFFSADLEGPRVRSFLCFRKDVTALESKHDSVFPTNFTSLRILHSTSIEFNRFPQRVTKLVHLRYIVLFVPDLTILPESLSQIWNLQTITVDTNSNSITMKANLWKMIRLRHVKTKASIVLDETWQGEAGKNLQTLDRVSPESVTAAFSQKARSIKTLGIRGKLDPLFENMPLGNMDHLEKLKLYHAATEIRLESFPDRNHFPPNLKRLTLSNTFLDWMHMSTLAMIRSLEVLKLKDNAFSGFSWKAGSGGFPSLKFLLIDKTNLVLWEAEPTTLPSLKHLVLKNCEYLSKIPDCLLEQLENLEIDGVLNSLADSARNSEAQFKLSIGPHLI